MGRRDSARDQVLALMAAELAAFLPERVVTRSVIADVAMVRDEDLARGLICVVAGGGGQFANWQGREAELGTLRGTVVGYVQVRESDALVEVERAELALLEDVLSWFGQRHPEALGSAYPGDYKQSSQLEHPMGWVALQFELRNL